MMNYVELYKNFRNYEDELLVKKTVYDQSQFWHSERKIYSTRFFVFTTTTRPISII